MNEEKGIVKYQSLTGQEIKLSFDIIRRYLVQGEGIVTEGELMNFLALCKYQKLNPFLREVYLIKYGKSPATMVTGKETFLKRAAKNPAYDGHETGISQDGKTAWAKIYVKGRSRPTIVEVDYNEYVGKKSDGTINHIWREKPRTMLKKVALVQALREAFPEDFAGLYSVEEVNTVAVELPIDEIKLSDKENQKGDTSSNPSPETNPSQDKNPPSEEKGTTFYNKVSEGEKDNSVKENKPDLEQTQYDQKDPTSEFEISAINLVKFMDASKTKDSLFAINERYKKLNWNDYSKAEQQMIINAFARNKLRFR